MKIRIGNGRIALADGIRSGAELEVRDGRIAAIEAASGPFDLDLDGGWLLPGFIDTQVNGGGGILFNDDPSVEAIRTIGAAHARFGTTAFLPTLISDTHDQVEAALSAVDEAIAAGVPGVVGVHIEGPFINVSRRGIHDAGRIRQLDAAAMKLLCAPRAGKVLLTIAPEQCSTQDIARLSACGVIVCAGHTNATYEQIGAAVEAGLRGFTHLFNAMSPLNHRAPGAVGAALDFADTYCGLIVDNAHLHPATVRIAVAAKRRERIMLVTDAMPSVGSGQSSFTLQGKEIWVRDGICTYQDGTLAGSDLDMASAVRNTAEITGLDISAVAQMASRTPAEFLGLSKSHGSLAIGARADWVWMDRELRVRETWIGGEPFCSEHIDREEVQR